MRTLKTRADVIDALGGTGPLAKELDATYRAVHNWREYSEHIPSMYYPYMIHRLHRMNLTAPASLWGVFERERKVARHG